MGSRCRKSCPTTLKGLSGIWVAMKALLPRSRTSPTFIDMRAILIALVLLAVAVGSASADEWRKACEAYIGFEVEPAKVTELALKKTIPLPTGRTSHVINVRTKYRDLVKNYVMSCRITSENATPDIKILMSD
jgi:hypothetical protein